MVVTATTKGNSAQAGKTPSAPNKAALIPKEGMASKREIIPEATMAVISLQALIRHQNQRRIKINPVPAPKTSNKLNSCIAF